MFKNKFVLIMSLCIVTLVILIVGVVTLYNDNSKEFIGSGYVISSTVDSNDKYYFSANTKYKANVDDDITFNDNDSKTVAVSPDSFVHYDNGSIAFLKKGAIVNLSELTNPYINYYNVKNDNLIEFNDGSYKIETNNNDKVNVSSFVGRISDKKYIIAGQDLTLKVPDRDEEVEGEYFEVLFVEDGIAKIVNDKNEFQVTAQGTYFYVGKDIVINLGDGKIIYDGEVRMLLSQITINGDENIDLKIKDKNDKNGGSGGNGSDSKEDKSDEDNKGDDLSGSENQDNNNDNNNEKTEDDNENVENGDKEDDSSQQNGQGIRDSASVELVSANVTTTSINVKLLLNNADYIAGELKAYITNVSTGNDVAFTIDTRDTNNINLENGTFDIVTSDSDEVEGTKEFHLMPDTEYLIRVVSEDNGRTNQYFQKIFKTKSLGISLEKMYATENSLRYKVNFEDTSSVSSVYLNILGDDISHSEKISSDDESFEIEFDGLQANANYSVYINNVTVSDNGSAAITYASRYNISRIDKTLKRAPTTTDRAISVDTDASKARFTITLDNISDPDKSIVGYTYEVYENGGDGSTLYSIYKNVNNGDTLNDAKELVLNLGQINELKQGVSYKCRVLVSYNNNEMSREFLIDDGAPFSLKSIPSITWNSDEFVVGKYSASGIINLVDASCSVPIKGRSCSDSNIDYKIKDAKFILKYYVVGDEEKNAKELEFKFNPETLKYEFKLDSLISNTNYVLKVYGSYYDDNNVYRSDVSFGTSTYFKTAKSDNLSLVINDVGESNDTNVVNFDMHLDKGSSQEKYEDIVTGISMNLYSGAYNNEDKLIGQYEITDRETIENAFDNININNGLFDNVTDLSVGDCESNKICNRQALTTLTNNSLGTLSSSYTIEITSVKVGEDTLVVENPIYTFVLTSSYYLDARIAANPNYAYVDVIPITKKDLTSEQSKYLKDNNIKNLDDLLDDTVVGVTINNNLSDLFVNSAFNYEKAVVNYYVHNNKTNKDVKVESVDMGNKYQPSSKILWLDFTDTKDGFIRGYNYTIGYTIDFTIDSSGMNSDEDVDVVKYGALKDNDSQKKLSYTMDIERQKPVFTQYISLSDSTSVTYKYSMTDIDNSLYDKSPYYTYSASDLENEDNVLELTSDKFNIDGDYHTIKLPIQDKVNYSWGYRYKKVNDTGYSNFDMDSYVFDGEFSYDNEIGFSIINDNDNKLKILLNDNEVNDRAFAYRVTLSASNVENYSRMFLASKLEKYGEFNEEEDLVDNRSKYIAIDYANISKFLKKNIKVSVEVFYNSGLVGLNQDFSNGLILKNIIDNKYLNIYNDGSQVISTVSEDDTFMGLNFLRTPYKEDSKNIYLYNLFMNTKNYNSNYGSGYYLDNSVSGRIGVNFNIDFTNQGIVLDDANKKYGNYNILVSKKGDLKTDNDNYKFDSITPKIDVTTERTINSFTIKITPSGIYSDTQFKESKVYIEVYSDPGCINKITTLESNFAIGKAGNSGYSAVIDDVSLNDLKPDTTYYFKVFAKMSDRDGYTQLYDSSSTSNYVTKIYSVKTLNGNEILNGFNFSVVPVKYNGEISTKSLSWKLRFNNLKNYKVRFELYKPNGFQNGDEIVWKQVNFDGTDSNSCNSNSFGDKDSGYVSNCYISIDKDSISDINNKEQTYNFSTNDFVFGGNYYKLIIYAVPYTKGEYVEKDKVILYENDSLSSYVVDGDSQNHYINISIPQLQEANIENALLNSGYDNGYYIDFKPRVVDLHKVIRFGKYTLSLKDENGNTIQHCKIISNLQTDGSYEKEDSFSGKDCSMQIDADEINNQYRIIGLDSDTLYSVVLQYNMYGNNVTNPFINKDKENNYYQYTPSNESGIRLGTVTGSRVGEQQLNLNYSSSVNLNKILKVEYTIQLVGGSSLYSGVLTSDNSNMFIVSGNSVTLNIDFTGNDSDFKIIKDQTYKVNTKYYYDLGKPSLNMTTFIDA